MIGATKHGEYFRTVDMLEQKTGKSREEVMYILYFLYDSQYCNKDLKNMADMIANELKLRREKSIDGSVEGDV